MTYIDNQEEIVSRSKKVKRYKWAGWMSIIYILILFYFASLELTKTNPVRIFIELFGRTGIYISNGLIALQLLIMVFTEFFALLMFKKYLNEENNYKGTNIVLIVIIICIPAKYVISYFPEGSSPRIMYSISVIILWCIINIKLWKFSNDYSGQLQKYVFSLLICNLLGIIVLVFYQGNLYMKGINYLVLFTAFYFRANIFFKTAKKMSTETVPLMPPLESSVIDQ